MIKDIYTHYEAFYNMLLSVTLMSNSFTSEVERDGKEIVHFIGKAYKLDSKMIAECEDCIFNKLPSLALTSDKQAMYNTVDPQQSFSDDEILLDVKAEVLTEIQNIGKVFDFVPFDYSHYNIYEPHIRFAKILSASVSGNVAATRQIGILKMLGIGCEQNTDDAIVRLFQATMWGDIPSMYLLAYTHKQAGNSAKSRLFYELAALCTSYLYSGITVLPEIATKTYSETACSYYIYISTILQDVALAYNKTNIDFSFVEAITSETLDHFDRMNYINNYDRKEWKNVTNSAIKPKRAIGFK